MKLFLHDEVNDIIMLVRDDVKYRIDYDQDGEIENLQLNLGNETYLDIKQTDDDGNEIKYSVLEHFSSICEKVEENHK